MIYVLYITTLSEGYFPFKIPVISFEYGSKCKEICNLLNSYKISEKTEDTIENIQKNELIIKRKISEIMNSEIKGNLVWTKISQNIKHIEVGSLKYLDTELFVAQELTIV